MKAYTPERLQKIGLTEKLPQHVGIIMDGNGRWAQKRQLPRTLGHRAGMERLKGIIRLSSDLGIKALTLYAFSTENWKRPTEEVGALCSLLIEYCNKEIRQLHENQVCMRMLGDTQAFSPAVREALDNAVALTKENTGLKLNLALNYGSHAELMHAIKLVAHEVQEGDLSADAIDEAHLERYLYTAGLPQLDFVIRTGGEKRLSNFMLYQCAYAEILFVDDFWPDFSNKRYVEALQEFQSRNRRYGGL